MSRTRASRRDERLHRRRLRVFWLVQALGALLGMAVAWLLVLSGGEGERPPAPGVPTSEPGNTAAPSPSSTRQADFLKDVIRDRKALIPGRLTCDEHLWSDVGKSEEFVAELIAYIVPERDASSRPLPGRKFRRIPVGGIEGATLTSSSSDLAIKALTHPHDKQVVAEPGDRAMWEWSVTASKPGDYTMKLRVSTYQGVSRRALATLSPPVIIHVHVDNTVSHRVSGFRSELVSWGGVAAATIAIFAFRGPLLTLVRARREVFQERRKKGRDGYM